MKLKFIICFDFFDLNEENSPYKQSNRLVRSFGLLSMFSGMNIVDENLPYYRLCSRFTID